MADVHKPRHIRDIAHLYISRMQPNDNREKRSVVVTGTTRDCFSGYHAANIAVGFANIGFSVRVIEISGLWPCSAHFLSLPARIYLKREEHLLGGEVSALGGVAIRFSIPEKGDAQSAQVGTSGRQRTPVRFADVIHLPIVEQTKDLQEKLAGVVAFAGQEIPVILLAANEGKAGAAWGRTNRLWRGADRHTLLLDSTHSWGGQQSRERRDIRHLTNWRRSLCDNVPCVIRDPSSYLSRSYLSICEAVISPSRFSEGKHAPRAASQPAATGPTC